MEITQELLHELFEYRDGVLYWKVSRGRLAKAGDPVGSLNNTGYMRTHMKGKNYLNHRLIFMMHHGYLPKYLDHINNNCLDNRIENLRECTRSGNQQNVLKRCDNTSGVKSVSWRKRLNKWQVRISVDGVRKYLGIYEDKELAELVAEEARLKYHGEFANHGNKNEDSR
jgi:HNH endonuclease/AP2 domain